MQNDELKPCPHEYVPTQVGHGLTQCKWCHGTMMENAFIAPNHCDTRAKQDAAWNQRTEPDELARLRSRVAVLEEALKDATETLSSVEIPSLLDPFHSPEIAALGDRIGYGALMHGASALWRHKLESEGGSGGEFVVGPCQKTITNAWMSARKALENRNE